MNSVFIKLEYVLVDSNNIFTFFRQLIYFFNGSCQGPFALELLKEEIALKTGQFT